jgi:GAF domain-containing protein
VDSVGVMLLDDHDRARQVGTTDEVSALLETGQIESGEGPGIDSLRTGETVATEDLSEPGRYPQLWRRLAGSGVRAVLSSPIRLDHAVIGNLNATLGRRHNWTAAQRRANQAYADVIGLALRASAQALDAGSRLLRLRRMGLVPEESPLWPVDPAGTGGPSPVGQPTTTTAEDE